MAGILLELDLRDERAVQLKCLLKYYIPFDVLLFIKKLFLLGVHIRDEAELGFCYWCSLLSEQFCCSLCALVSDFSEIKYKNFL